MEKEFDSNQIDHERGTSSELRRYMDSIKDRQCLKIARDATIVLFGTTEVTGVVETPNHYKCVNVVVNDLPEDQCCKDIVIAQRLQVLKPGSNKIPVVIRNLSCRTLKLKKRNKNSSCRS